MGRAGEGARSGMGERWGCIGNETGKNERESGVESKEIGTRKGEKCRIGTRKGERCRIGTRKGEKCRIGTRKGEKCRIGTRKGE
eukprot:719697-Pleurochrysis_carterae.AAC.1